MFANAIRAHTRLRVLTATRIALPATRNITSLVAFRTAVPKNVSLSASRSFTISQVAREESQVAPKELEGSQAASEELEDPQVAPKELEESQVAPIELEESQVAPKELEDSQIAPKELEDSQVVRNLEDGAPRAPLGTPNSTVFCGNLPWKATEDEVRETFSQFGEILGLRMHYYQHGLFRGTCHIDFASEDSAVAAVTSVAQNAIIIAGRKLRVEYADGSARRPVTDPTDRLYYKGCEGDEPKIRTIFQQFSDSIVTIHPLKNPRTGEPTKAGFVGFNSVETATKALEVLNGAQTPNGESLALSYARAMRSKVKLNNRNPSKTKPSTLQNPYESK